jgi:pilus assembly protein CpaB
MIRVALLALIACGLAGFGTVVWMVMPHNQDVAAAAAVPVDKIKVIIAAKALKPGALLKNEDTAIREIDQDKLPEGYIPAGDDNTARRSLMGGMVRRSMVAGDVVLNDDVLKPGDHGFLAAVLRPGYRAVTVAVDAVSGAAGLIWPGDRVDLILTQTLDDKDAASPAKKIAAETVLRDVRVIAIDQQMVQNVSGTIDGSPARTVTLEVSSASGEQVQVATRLGKLSLAVRSAEHGPSEDSDGTTWAGDVSSALNAQKARPIANTMKVYGGASDGKEFKF